MKKPQTLLPVDPEDTTLYTFPQRKPVQYVVVLPAETTPMLVELLKHTTLTAGETVHALVRAMWIATLKKPIPTNERKHKSVTTKEIHTVQSILAQMKNTNSKGASRQPAINRRHRS